MSDIEDIEDSYDAEYDEYEEEDHEPEVIGWTRTVTYFLERIKGVLYITQSVVTGIRYSGQDWGEAEFQEDTFTGQSTEFKRNAALAFRKLAKRLKPGEQREVTPDLLQDVIDHLDTWTEDGE
jgi:hypothetical protein